MGWPVGQPIVSKELSFEKKSMAASSQFLWMDKDCR